jgi:hypothetical protein
MEVEMWKASEIEKPGKLLNQELESLATLVSNLELSHRADIDDLKLEIQTLKLFLAECHPEFDTRYALLKERVRLEVSPE